MDSEPCAVTKAEWDRLITEARVSADLLFSTLWKIERHIWGSDIADQYIGLARGPLNEILATAEKNSPCEGKCNA